MHGKQQSQNLISRSISIAAKATLTIAIVLAQSSQAQTYRVIHDFTGGVDGAGPQAGLTVDEAGHLYGTTVNGGVGDCAEGCGTVFKLSNNGSGWIFGTLYSFLSGDDGDTPLGRVTGWEGSLYGTTYSGGGGCHGFGCGTVFSLSPPASPCRTASCSWTETVLYRFNGSDGHRPYGGDVVLDGSGHLYGTTRDGGVNVDTTWGDGYGIVYELTPVVGGWTERILHAFGGARDGWDPCSGVTFDNAGNLYGTTEVGGDCSAGTVYELAPTGFGWTKKILYSFCSQSGVFPSGGLVFDQLGNLLGTTTSVGPGGGGTVFMLSPAADGWTFTLLYSFTGPFDGGPTGVLTMDRAGNIYGTTKLDGSYGYGAVFRLTPGSGGWTYTSLHDFTGGSDGGIPVGGVILHPNGRLYGTASRGGAYGWQGVVWEITP